MNLNRVAVGWLTLIILYTIVEKNTSDKVSGALNGISGVVTRLSDPNVALIPNYSKAPAPATGTAQNSNSTVVAPGQTVIPNAQKPGSTGLVTV